MIGRAGRDLALAVAVVVVGGALFATFDIVERIETLTAGFEHTELDDVLLAVVLAFVMAAWFAARRWTDSRASLHALQASEQAQELVRRSAEDLRASCSAKARAHRLRMVHDYIANALRRAAAVVGADAALARGRAARDVERARGAHRRSVNPRPRSIDAAEPAHARRPWRCGGARDVAADARTTLRGDDRARALVSVRAHPRSRARAGLPLGQRAADERDQARERLEDRDLCRSNRRYDRRAGQRRRPRVRSTEADRALRLRPLQHRTAHGLPQRRAPHPLRGQHRHNRGAADPSGSWRLRSTCSLHKGGALARSRSEVSGGRKRPAQN